MDRLISEQKVLKVIDNLKANFTCYDSVTLDEVASHVKAIPSAEPKWIPVERLPEDDGLYLVYTEEQPFVCPFKDGEFFIDEVLAWMPLPTPYEPQERSE